MEATSNPPGEPYLIAEPAYAGFWIRLGAYALDQMLLAVVVTIFALLIAIPTVILVQMLGRTLDPEKYGNVMGFCISYPTIWLYMTIFESSKWQGTPGKLALGLRVTDERGARISFARANGRFFAKILSGLPCGAGYLMIAFNDRKQGFHDRLAGTLVIRRASAP